MSRRQSQLFSWRQAVLKSLLPPVTKHVLLTLSCHMTDAGENCFPSVETLCEETSLSKPTVIAHLKRAAELGWIEIRRHGFGDRRWLRQEYLPRWPDEYTGAEDTRGGKAHLPPEQPENDDEAVNELNRHEPQGGKAPLPPQGDEAVNVLYRLEPRGGKADSTEAVKELNRSTSVNSSEVSNTPPYPPTLDVAAWEKWVAYRRQIRKPLKPVSIPAAQRKLAAFGCYQMAAVEHSIASGYQGLFLPREFRCDVRPSGRKTFDDYRREQERRTAEAEAREHAIQFAIDSTAQRLD